MKKGQYFVLEQMLLFTIGVFITIILYFSLVSANESIKYLTEKDQAYEIGNLVLSGINKVYTSPGNSTLILYIPKKIDGKEYKIYIKNENSEKTIIVNIGRKNSEKDNIKIPLNNKYNAFGMLFSSSGKLKIEKSGNKILIGRPL